MYNFSKVTRAKIDFLVDTLNPYECTVDNLTKELDDWTFGMHMQLNHEARDNFELVELATIYHAVRMKSKTDRLENSARILMLEYLAACDPNGCYRDDDCLAEGFAPLSLHDACIAHCQLVDES